jgi:hypothetical protein
MRVEQTPARYRLKWTAVGNERWSSILPRVCFTQPERLVVVIGGSAAVATSGCLVGNQILHLVVTYFVGGARRYTAQAVVTKQRASRK